LTKYSKLFKLDVVILRLNKTTMFLTKYEILLKQQYNVFNIKDLSILWGYKDQNKTHDLARYYVSSNKLFLVKKGLYSTSNNPNQLIVAQKIINPSYISYFTALKEHGIIFQWYETIYSASLKSRKIVIGQHNYEYKQLKKEIFFYPIGIIQKEGYHIACPERAICDMLYSKPDTYFDNLKNIDIELLTKIAKIYNYKPMIKSLKIWFPKIKL
jgi:predicted transcriptional regulator of viral defense system